MTAGAGQYEVEVRTGLLGDLPGRLGEIVPGHRYAVVSDDRVAPLYGETFVAAAVASGLRADLFTFPAGEAQKSRSSWSDLTDRMLAAGHGRDSVVVALGGGVTGDLGGFVAATFMRGIPVVQVPTSLVAMIDASVGGKTGVDVSAGKNLVGAFHAPRFVAADPATIATLPEPHRAGGLAEALKHGAILDRHYFQEMVDGAAPLMAADPASLEPVVRRSVEIKAGVVGEDEREAGYREILNFGHTLGHALEAGSDYGMSHGVAVALGMVLEARVGERIGVTDPGTADTLAAGASRFGLPVSLADVDVGTRDAGAILAYARRDKKARAGRARYVLLERPGTVARDRASGRWSREVDDDVVHDVLAAALGSGGA